MLWIPLVRMLLMYMLHTCVHQTFSVTSYELPEIPPCEVVFPKQGEQLQSGAPVYSLLVCHLTDEMEEQLNQLNRQFSVAIKVLALNPETLQYQVAMAPPPITSYATEIEAQLKINLIAEVFMSSQPLQVDLQYKVVYQILVGTVLVDQVSTVVTFRNDDYFQRLLGAQAVHVLDVNNLCHNSTKGEYCPSKKAVLDATFTQKMDFIEVGTSAFDTCIQKADNHHRGISVEPLDFYLDMLPSPSGVIKEAAAMSATESRSGLNFGVMYYMDPRDLAAAGMTLDGPHYWMYGLSSFGSVQGAMLQAYRLEKEFPGTPAIYLQKSRIVPLLSMEELYTKHAVREVGLLKLDCEGLDTDIVASLIPMLQKYELPYPCVLMFEVSTANQQFYKTVQMLQQVGYNVMSVSHLASHASAGDFYATHRQCSEDDKKETSQFLSRSFGEAQRLCRAQGMMDVYCCTTFVDFDGEKLQLCDQRQAFHVP